MSTFTLTKDNFEATVQEHEIVLVDFWAGWCGPCQQFAPIYEQAAQAHDEIAFGSIDTEAEQELASAAGISSIPTLMAFKKGHLVFSQAGALPAPALEDLIGQLKTLDIDAAVAAAEAEEADGTAQQA